MEKMLLEELETSLVLTTGFLSCCLHTWRRYVTLKRARRGHDAELHRVRLAFERHLAHLDLTVREDSRLAFRERRLRTRETVEPWVRQWHAGHVRWLAFQAVSLWAKVAAKTRSVCLLRAYTDASQRVLHRSGRRSRAL